MNNLAVALKNLDRLSEAEELYVEIRRIAAPVYGESHPYVLNAINNHVALLQVRRDLTAAEELCRESLRLATGGEPLPERLTALKHLASILTAQHDYVQAEPAFREALTEHRQLFGNDHPATAVVMAEFGAMLRDGVATAAAYSEAEELLLGALAFFEQKFPPNHPYRAKTIDQLRRLYGPDAMNDPARLAAYDSDPPS
jgi:serine/threonine-protein kinase